MTKTKHSLQKSLCFWFLGLSLIPMALMVAIGLSQATQALKQDAAILLTQTAEAKAAFIVNWFDYRFKDLDYQAQNQLNSEFVQALVRGLGNSKSSAKEYTQSYDWVRKKTPNEEALLNLTRKYSYIYDIFLIDLSGNILFSIAQKEDLGSNLFIGDHSSTLFAQSVRQTLDSGRSLFSGIERYAPSNNMLAGFLTAPLLDDNGDKVGVLAIQIKLDQLYQQVSTFYSSQESQEFHSTHRHYLVDNTGLLLSPINDHKQVLLRKVDSQAVQDWQQKKPLDATLLEPYLGPDGLTVFGYKTSINIGNIHWLLLSEINQADALFVINDIQETALSFLALLALLSAAIALFQAKRIVRPIIKLSEVTQAVAKGKSQQQVVIERADEVGELAATFNYMIRVREKYIKTISDNNHDIQQALNELSEQKFAFDQHAIVAITDLAGTISYANDRFCNISGYERDELIGSNHRLLNSGHHPREFFEQMFYTLTAGNVWHGEVCNLAKSGVLYWVDTTIVPIKDADGELNSYIAIRTDISHMKQVEIELMETANNAKAANTAKSEFLANMSHEIRTPLNGVIGMTSLLLDSGLTNEQHARTKIVANSANGLLTIINDILDFSKIEAGKLELEIIDFDLAALISDVAASMAFRAEEKHIELICPANPLQSNWYKGDPNRIRQVLINLIGNAIKFTPTGEVSVNVHVVDNRNGQHHLLVEVTDTGIGLSYKQQQGLFERFTQADSSTTRQYGGTGLGLTISKQLVELMGGEIAVESTLNEGSTFTIAVTLYDSEHSAEANSSNALSNESILIVDNNYTNRKLLKELLTLWGIPNQQVETAKEAIQMLGNAAEQGKPYSMAIVDMQMSETDDLQLVQSIRQQDNIASTQLVLLTSQARRGDAQKMRDIGFNGFLSKPVNQSDLYNLLLQVYGLADDARLLTRHPSRKLNLFSAQVLVVEDNVTNQLVARGMLENLGLNVSIVNNGKEAIEALSSQRYDLVFMDSQMPIMDGFQASTIIRDTSSGVLQHDIPIIAMTANAMAEDKEHCLAVGMNDFVAKPVNPSLLLSALNKWLPKQNKDRPVDEETRDCLSEEALAFEASKKLQLPPSKELIFDHSVLQNLLGDEETIQSVITAFISEIPSQLDQLELALADADASSAGAITHKIKGSAASTGANALAQLAKNMEISAKEGDLQPVADGLKTLASSFRLLQETLENDSA